jgi:hypothetical protein
MIINPYVYGSGGGAFVPTDISGCVLWLRADKITGLSDGDPVANWPDFSGNGYDVSQSTSGKKPIWKATLFGGQPCVQFDGVNDTMIGTTGPSVSQPYSVVTIGRLLASNVSNAAFTDGAVGGSRCHVVYIRDGTSTYSFYGWAIAYAGAISTSTAYAWIGIGDAASSKLYLNGSDTGQSGDPGSSAINGWCLASNEPADGGGASYLACDIAESIIYNKTLSSPEMAQLWSYAGTQYGI